MARLEAQEELGQRQRKGPLTAGRLFDLVLLATGDRDEAERAYKAFRHEELKAGITPTA